LQINTYTKNVDIELTCFTYEGIDALIETLKAGEAVSTKEIEIKVFIF